MSELKPHSELAAIIREGIDAESGMYTEQENAEVALNSLLEQYQAAVRVVDAARACSAYRHEPTHEDIVALRKAIGRFDTEHRVSSPASSPPDEIEVQGYVGDQAVGPRFRMPNPASSPEITGDGSGHALPPMQEGYSAPRTDVLDPAKRPSDG